MAKYNNKKMTIDNIKFDSTDEALYYLYLKDKRAAGEVIEFTCQPKFTLLESYYKYGKKIRPMTYTPDFYVKYSDGREEYIDVKGMSTQASEMRRKLFDYFYQDLHLRWVQRNMKYGTDGWIDLDDLKKIKSANKRKLKQSKEKVNE